MPLRFVYIAYFALLFCNVPHHNIILQTSAIIPLSTHKRMLYTTVSLCCIWGRFGTVKAGARRWNCHETRCPTRRCTTISLSSPRLPYHAIIVLSTAYQWMAGAINCVYDIRGWLGAANAGAWCHKATIRRWIIRWKFDGAISSIETPRWWCIPSIPTAYYRQMKTTVPSQYMLGTKFIWSDGKLVA